MDKQQAQRIIRETFESPFDKGRFTNFMKNLLNRIDESKAFHAHGYVKEGFRGVIKTYERIGTYNSTDDKKVDIIVVYLQKGFSLDHARVTQRNFAGRYLADRGNKNAGLFAFVSPEESDWRFSLVTIDYEIVQSKAGNWKGREKFSQARRWSFLVGENEKSHTAQSRLINILADDEQDPTLEEIEKAFDIETVTKEFFLKYRELFLRTKEELDRVVKKDPKINADFEAKGVDTVNFAKKLLGQIVFLYFLQKKGWFGVGRDDDWGTGSKHFLRELFKKKHGNYNNFFNDILEPLFYEALRIDRSHDDGYYSRFDCKIPFLNGGLFDPIGNYDWVRTDILIPDRLFFNNVKTKEGDKGTGILDVFDRYNFTVKEDEPLEKEVAIDPELLGKAYEKFNAIRPDNFEEFKRVLKSGKKGEENKFNKKFGVYYTPREIVHYMCRQSLINYLATELEGKAAKEDIEALIHTGEQVSENEARVLSKGKETKTYSHQLSENIRKNAKLIDDKLAEITVCDPAVGSGAFPVGMMSEIVKTRNVLSVFLNDKERTTYDFKRRCIEHSLYGVDIDPGAVEIAKLRLWLSLVVDEDDIKNIKPLPNLDYRIMQGNSLISEFMGISFDSDKKKSENLIFKSQTDELIEQFQQKKDEFLNESNVSRKSKLKEEVDDLLVKIFETKLRTQKGDYFNRLKNIENKYSVLRNEKQRAELVKQDKETLYKQTGFDLESAEKQLKEFTSGRKIKPFFLWDLYFSEVFHQKGGFNVVIANPPYITIALGKKQKFFSEGEVASLKNNFENVFEYKGNTFSLFFAKSIKLLNTKGVLTFITPNTLLLNSTFKKTRKYFLDNCIIKKLVNIPSSVFESGETGGDLITILNKGNNKETAVEATDIEKIADFNYGAHVNYIKQTIYNATEENKFYLDIQFLKLIKKIVDGGIPLGNIVQFYQGIITGNNKKFLANKKLNNKYKKILRGRDIHRYFYNYGGTYVYFDKNKLWSNTNEKLFRAKEKLINRQTGHDLIAAYDDTGIFTLDSTHIQVLKDSRFNIKYILALFNSSLLNFYYRQTTREEGRVFAQVKTIILKKLPIRYIPTEKQRAFIVLVDKIISNTKGEDVSESSRKQDKVDVLEKKIDQLVYKHYGLTPEEIKIVEGKNENAD